MLSGSGGFIRQIVPANSFADTKSKKRKSWANSFADNSNSEFIRWYLGVSEKYLLDYKSIFSPPFCAERIVF